MLLHFICSADLVFAHGGVPETMNSHKSKKRGQFGRLCAGYGRHERYFSTKTSCSPKSMCVMLTNTRNFFDEAADLNGYTGRTVFRFAVFVAFFCLIFRNTVRDFEKSAIENAILNASVFLCSNIC